MELIITHWVGDSGIERDYIDVAAAIGFTPVYNKARRIVSGSYELKGHAAISSSWANELASVEAWIEADGTLVVRGGKAGTREEITEAITALLAEQDDQDTTEETTMTDALDIVDAAPAETPDEDWDAIHDDMLDRSKQLLDAVIARLIAEQPGVKVEPSPFADDGRCARAMLRAGQELVLVSRFPDDQVFTMHYGRWVAGWSERHLDERRPATGEQALEVLREWAASGERATEVSPAEVRARREALGLSQRLFARALGMDKQVTVARWEKGTSAPSRGHMADLLEVEKGVERRARELADAPGRVLKLRQYGHADMEVADALERVAVGRAVAARRASGVPTAVSGAV